MVGMRPIYQITCVQILFPHIKGGAKVADYLLNAIAKAAFFQAFPAFESTLSKTPWNSGLFFVLSENNVPSKKTTFKQVGEEVG
jgi:hypothetical protein